MKYSLLLFAIILFSCKQNIIEELPSDNMFLFDTQIYDSIPGIDPNLLSLDIYYNDDLNNKRPVVIWVHGGAWATGDKANQLENKIHLFESLNYILVSVNYQLSPFPYEIDNPDRILYPQHNIDVAHAIQWVFGNIEEYGGNTSKIALIGHSAGAQLVSLLGTNPTFLENVGLDFQNIKGIATIDTKGYDVQAKIEEGSEIYINAFGEDFETIQEASPLLNIDSNKFYPNFFVGKRGNESRIASSDEFISALENAGTIVHQVDGTIYDHSGINQAIGTPNETLITNPLIRFLEECFE